MVPSRPCKRSSPRVHTRLRCLSAPIFNFFSAAHSGAIIRLLSELPVMVFVEGNCLLLDQAVAGITSSVGGFEIGGGTSTPAPQSFLDRYSMLSPGDDTSLSFQMVLPSHAGSTIQVVGGSHHVIPPVHHRSWSSCPNPVGVNFALSARTLPSYGRQGIVPYAPVPPYVHPPQPSQGVPYDYGGFFLASTSRLPLLCPTRSMPARGLDASWGATICTQTFFGAWGVSRFCEIVGS
jgi:hypothetical protein